LWPCPFATLHPKNDFIFEFKQPIVEENIFRAARTGTCMLCCDIKIRTTKHYHIHHPHVFQLTSRIAGPGLGAGSAKINSSSFSIKASCSLRNCKRVHFPVPFASNRKQWSAIATTNCHHQ
jgi:hypothetical protein